MADHLPEQVATHREEAARGVGLDVGSPVLEGPRTVQHRTRPDDLRCRRRALSVCTRHAVLTALEEWIARTGCARISQPPPFADSAATSASTESFSVLPTAPAHPNPSPSVVAGEHAPLAQRVLGGRRIRLAGLRIGNQRTVAERPHTRRRSIAASPEVTAFTLGSRGRGEPRLRGCPCLESAPQTTAPHQRSSHR